MNLEAPDAPLHNPLTIRLPSMNPSQPPVLRRSSRRRTSSDGPSGSEYQQSEKSFHEEEEELPKRGGRGGRGRRQADEDEVEIDDEEEEEVEKMQTKRGRLVTKKSYVESEEDADGDADPDIIDLDGNVDDLMDFNNDDEDLGPRLTRTRRSTRPTRASEASANGHGLRRSTRNLPGFIEEDEDEDEMDEDEAAGGGRRLRSRSRLTRNKPVPVSNGHNSRRTRSGRSGTRSGTRSGVGAGAGLRRSTRNGGKKDPKEDDYIHATSSSRSRSGSGSVSAFDDAPGTDDMDLEMDIPLEPDPNSNPPLNGDEIGEGEEEGTDTGAGGGKKPYSLRRRAKINYAIPPPLEDLSRPPGPGRRGGQFGNAGGNGGRDGYGGGRGFGARGAAGGGARKKGLGWSASGAELGRWMGLAGPGGGDDSDSDAGYPNRTPRKGSNPFAAGLGAGSALAGGMGLDGGGLDGGLLPAGTPGGASAANLASLGKVDANSLADADPLGVNVNVTFDEIGGLDEHINSLKEMTLLPLLYPELFTQFNVTPPRGVLFHGPPGTGKTLMARALAASCRKEGKEITFFMRKGADALSKWVGEAERQLRLLFNQARACAPSIIFFDEIDGLAPVRSSKQDQIHSSIVSTLLALMDGMDGRGQVVVIGATNRVDSVDPALRRPGRFDREFYFPLPSVEAREKILGIMTRGWKGWGVTSSQVQSQKQGRDVNVKRITLGGGEDKGKDKDRDGDESMHMQGVEIQSGAEGSRVDVLEKDEENKDVQNRNSRGGAQDEEMEMENVKKKPDGRKEKEGETAEGNERAEEEEEEKQFQLTKARERVKGLAKLTKGYGGADLRALCTEAALNAIQRKYPQIYKSNDRLMLKPESIEVGLRDFMISVKKIIPSSARSSASSASPLPPQFVPLLSDTLDRAKEVVGRVLPVEKRLTALEEAEFEDELDVGNGNTYEYVGSWKGKEKDRSGEEEVEREMGMQSMEILRIHRPRLILHGPVGMGQNYVGAALLQHLEGYHVQSLELGSLLGDSARTVEAALVQLFVEAKRHSPSVIYIPSLMGWCAAISETARSTVRAMLDTLAPTDAVLLLAIVDGSFSSLPRDVRAWFGASKQNRVEFLPPSSFQRAAFFQPLLDDIRKPPNKFPGGVPRKKRVLEELPVAPPLAPRKPTEAELAVQVEQDLRTITILKYRLGPIMSELKRKFKRFTKRAREEYKEEFSLLDAEAELEREPGSAPAPVAVPIEGMDAVAQAQAMVIQLPDAPMDLSQNPQQQQPPPLVNGYGHGINGVDISIEVVPVHIPPIDVDNPNPNPLPSQFQPVPVPTEPHHPSPEPQPQLFDMDLEHMHENLYKDRYLAPNEFLSDIKKIVHNAAMYSHRDPDRHYKAQAMLTATEVSIQDFDAGLRVECERMAGRERKRRAEYKEKRAKEREAEREKEKEREKEREAEQLLNGNANINANGGTRRSARNNGQQPELAITDPVALERKLKRQRDGTGVGGRGGSEEDHESAVEGSRDVKRSRLLEDSNDRDPLDIRTPPRQAHTPPRHGASVRFASMDPMGFQHQNQQGPPPMFDAFQHQHQHSGSNSGFQQGASPMHMGGHQLPFNSMPQQPLASGSNPYPPSSHLHPSMYSQQHDLGLYNHSQQSLSPHPGSSHPHQQQHPFSPHSQPSFSQQVFPPSHPPFQPQPQFPQSHYQQQPQFHQQASYQPQHHQHQLPTPSNYQGSLTPTPVLSSIAQESLTVDRPSSATRNSGVAMLLNPMHPGEERISPARASPTPQRPRPDSDESNPFLVVPAPHSRRSHTASPHPPPPQLQSILKSPVSEKPPSPLPVPIIERTPTPLPDFHVDDVLVEQLHASLRETTSSLTIEELEQLRATCLGCIWRHRSAWDRNSLVRELQDVVSDFVAEIEDMNASDLEP